MVEQSARILAAGLQGPLRLHRAQIDDEVLFDSSDPKSLLYRDLELRRFFEVTDVNGRPTIQPVIARALADPGELTQGLCSPWQNDYRECACYYWAASRPDDVNVVDTASGETRGDNWMNKPKAPGNPHYVLDDRSDPRLLSYDDLFRDWQGFALRHRRQHRAGRRRSNRRRLDKTAASSRNVSHRSCEPDHTAAATA